MADVLVGQERVTAPEQFTRFIEQQLKQRPTTVERFIRLDAAKQALREIVAEWKAEGLNPEHSLVKLSVALADFAGAIGLDEGEILELFSA
jgi:hypothetical protein